MSNFLHTGLGRGLGQLTCVMIRRDVQAENGVGLGYVGVSRRMTSRRSTY
jgi:hypothetical protein